MSHDLVVLDPKNKEAARTVVIQVRHRIRHFLSGIYLGAKSNLSGSQEYKDMAQFVSDVYKFCFESRSNSNEDPNTIDELIRIQEYYTGYVYAMKLCLWTENHREIRRMSMQEGICKQIIDLVQQGLLIIRHFT